MVREEDRDSVCSDYSYWSESELDQDETDDSCELSSDNYTDNSDIFSPNQSSTCELSTHNYTPNTVFSPTESLRELSIHDDTKPTPAQSTDSLNSDADYVNVPTVVDVYYTGPNQEATNPLQRSNAKSQETEMGNASNKVGPVLPTDDNTVAATHCGSHGNSRFYSSRKHSFKRNVSLLTFSMTPVCVGAGESTTVLTDTDAPPATSSISLTKDVVSMVPELFRARELSSPPSSVQSDASNPASPCHTQETPSSTDSSYSDFQERSAKVGGHRVNYDADDDDDENDPWELRRDSKDFFTYEGDDSSDDDEDQEYSLGERSLSDRLKSMHESLEVISKSLDSYENDLEELSYLQDLSETFSSLDSSFSSATSVEGESETSAMALSDLDSSFTSISSFDSSDDSFTYEPLKTSPTVHHQVKVNASKSLEHLSSEKLLPETAPVRHNISATGSSASGLLDSGSFTTPSRKWKSCDRKSLSFSCDSKRSPASTGRDCEQYPPASTPVSKLLTGAVRALSGMSPRDLMRQFNSASSLDSGCESHDSGYKSRKFNLSSNAQSSASSSTEKVSQLGKNRRKKKASQASTTVGLSSRSSSYEEIAEFLGAYGRSTYPNLPASRVPPLMLMPEDNENANSVPPSLPERPSSPLPGLAAVVDSNDTSISSAQAIPSNESSNHPLYSSTNRLDISPSRKPTSRKSKKFFSRKFRSIKNLVKRRRSSSEVKHLGNFRQQQTQQSYAVPYKNNPIIHKHPIQIRSEGSTVILKPICKKTTRTARDFRTLYIL